MRKSSLHSQILVVLALLIFSGFKKQVLTSFNKTSMHNQVKLSASTKPPVEVLCPIRKELQEIKKSYGNTTVAPLLLSEKKRELREIAERVSIETGVPSELLLAICEVESNSNEKAFRRNDGGRLNHAFGICQVLRKTGEMVLVQNNKTSKAKMNGCRQNYKWTPKSKRTVDKCPLFDPYMNLTAAALYLKSQMKRYDSLEKLIASYNAGSLRISKKSGDYINRKYIDKVYATLHKQHQENYELTLN